MIQTKNAQLGLISNGLSRQPNGAGIGANNGVDGRLMFEPSSPAAACPVSRTLHGRQATWTSRWIAESRPEDVQRSDPRIDLGFEGSDSKSEGLLKVDLTGFGYNSGCDVGSATLVLRVREPSAGTFVGYRDLREIKVASTPRMH